ncbi:hypothetical protein SCHPADRAFT_941835 [Schizopora paradoxa]|uniref:Uncharacterized protein n=1 Tax=Schizopora paradoxa TaxID=27342 RepID=A0A0H2S3Z9_9AGAM|nr:hypothetical protein SCHPADRAFT_941835 [Schizopora paradoxa]
MVDERFQILVSPSAILAMSATDVVPLGENGRSMTVKRKKRGFLEHPSAPATLLAIISTTHSLDFVPWFAYPRAVSVKLDAINAKSVYFSGVNLCPISFSITPRAKACYLFFLGRSKKSRRDISESQLGVFRMSAWNRFHPVKRLAPLDRGP